MTYTLENMAVMEMKQQFNNVNYHPPACSHSALSDEKEIISFIIALVPLFFSHI